VVVLAIVSALVGVAALFANSSSNSIEQLQPVWSAAEGCAFLPYLFDSRFALFWLCLHGVLFLATVASMMAIVITRLVMHRDITIPSPLRVPAASSMAVPAMSKTTYVKMHGSQESVQTSESAGPPAPSTTGGGGGPLAASASSTAVHQTSRWNAHRHWTAAAVLTVTYLTHHLPLLVRIISLCFRVYVFFMHFIVSRNVQVEGGREEKGVLVSCFPLRRSDRGTDETLE